MNSDLSSWTTLGHQTRNGTLLNFASEKKRSHAENEDTPVKNLTAPFSLPGSFLLLKVTFADCRLRW